MGSRDKEHEAWNLEHGLKPGELLMLFCPRCAMAHQETLTNDPSQPDYLHHVHQCTYCGLRFDLYVRCRSTGESDTRSTETRTLDAIQRLASCVKDGVLQMRDVDRASVYKEHLGKKLSDVAKDES